MKLTYDMFYGDRQLNAFMHAADVFEKGKQLANFQRFDMPVFYHWGVIQQNEHYGLV